MRWAENGKEALSIFKEANASKDDLFDICIFDVMMDQMDGFTLASKVVALNPDVPFLFLTAKRLKEDKIRGLKLGADDYIVKPFDADILVLKLQNILKRIQLTNKPVKKIKTYEIGKFVFDPKNHLLTSEETVQALTARETSLISYLVEHPNMLIKRADILNAVWGSDDFFSGRSMDVYISKIRRYFKSDPSIAIEVTRGVGLMFVF